MYNVHIMYIIKLKYIEFCDNFDGKYYLLLLDESAEDSHGEGQKHGFVLEATTSRERRWFGFFIFRRRGKLFRVAPKNKGSQLLL